MSYTKKWNLLNWLRVWCVRRRMPALMINALSAAMARTMEEDRELH